VFIPIAERINLILKLDSFAINQSCAVAATWEAATPGLNPPYVAVNLSARHFHDPTLLPMIELALASSGLPSERLVLEITEGVALRDIESAIVVIAHLKHLGIALALDDFGTGYSSLSYLAKLEPDTIKIDRSFVSPVPKSNSARRLLEAIVSLCNVLDLTTLAEGIETSAQLKELLQLGCNLGQGFLFSRAVPADQVLGTSESVMRNWENAVRS
jgi:EAL domain-containing protein (putative c-di-GMP-specific phosphodiesterase class I)